jgi:hypothetical protein
MTERRPSIIEIDSKEHHPRNSSYFQRNVHCHWNPGEVPPPEVSRLTKHQAALHVRVLNRFQGIRNFEQCIKYPLLIFRDEG